MITAERFTAEYEAGFVPTVKYLAGRFHGAIDYEDTAQESWAKAWWKREQYGGQAKFLTWVFRIATNEALDRIRSQRSSRIDRHAEVPERSVLPMTSERLDAERLLASMGFKNRKLSILYYFAGMDVREISQATGWNENTIKVRMMRGRRQALAAVDKSVRVKQRFDRFKCDYPSD